MWFRLKRWWWEMGAYPSQHVHRETEWRVMQAPEVAGMPNPCGDVVVEWCRRCRWVR